MCKSRPFSVLMLLLLCAMSGCATLDVGVDVYEGDLIYGKDTQLSTAYGCAAFNRTLAQKYAADLCTRAEQEHDPVETGRLTAKKQEVQSLVAFYDAEQIDRLKQELDATPKADPSFESKRDRLVNAINRFNEECLSVGQETGLTAIFSDWFWYLNKRSREDVGTGIALEQASLRSHRLASNVQDSVQRTEIANMLLSTYEQGVIANTLTGGTLSEQTERAQFKEINHVHVEGSGKTNYVVVKDEVGNWNIKTVLADQTEVINAVFDGATAMVDVLGHVYGIPGVLPNSESSTASSAAPASQPSDGLNVQTAQAERVQRRLRRAQTALRTAVTKAIENADAKVNTTQGQKADDKQVASDLRAVVTDLIGSYQSQIGAIDASTSTTQPSATDQKPTK